MIKTTIYDNMNACSIGFYHDDKGVKHALELIGTETECMDSVALLQHNDVLDVVHVVVRHNVKSVFPVYESNTLSGVWK